MTPETFTINVNAFSEWLKTSITKDVLVEGALNLSMAINRRVEMSGENSSGGMFSPYALSTLKRKKNKANKFKNFSDTRDMWLKFGIKAQDKDKVVVGGKEAFAQDKIDWNSRREKDNIIQPSQKEVDKLTEYVSKRIQEELNKIGK